MPMSAAAPIASISFIGLGLIGMSLLQAIRRTPQGASGRLELRGFDPAFGEEDRQAAAALGLDRFTEEPRELYSADLVLLSAPVEINIATLDDIARLATPSTLVCDVSSTKSMIAHRARELSLPFIGLHPMAGKEQQGYRQSQAELLHGRTLIVCAEPARLAEPKGSYLLELLASAGCRLVFMDADEHDRTVARVSHLPQLLSTLLMNHCREEADKGGPGFASMARLSASPWSIWRDIVATNATNIADELDLFARALTDLSNDVRQGRLERIEARFEEANRLHKTLGKADRP